MVCMCALQVAYGEAAWGRLLPLTLLLTASKSVGLRRSTSISGNFSFSTTAGIYFRQYRGSLVPTTQADAAQALRPV